MNWNDGSEKYNLRAKLESAERELAKRNDLQTEAQRLWEFAEKISGSKIHSIHEARTWIEERIAKAERECAELRAERDRLREALDNLSEVQIWSDGEDYMCLGCRSITGDADLIEHREDCRFMLARKALAPKDGNSQINETDL